jgi:triosephosphate isomerase
MRRPIVAGNWKLHGSRAENARLVEEIMAQVPSKPAGQCIVCPPLVYLQEVGRLLRGSSIELGAQDVCAETHGAFTGEVSAAMLKDVGCEYVIVGHSERRQFHGETDESVNRKVKACLAFGLKAIVCVGEDLEQRESGEEKSVVSGQLSGGLAGLTLADMERIIIAYEPVWAIGTGKTATPEQAQEMHAYIRRALSGSHSAECAAGVRILYGGSVKPDNIRELMDREDIDGALVGGASLDAGSFSGIVNYR